MEKKPEERRTWPEPWQVGQTLRPPPPWEPEPFNPRIGAGVYGNNLMLPLGPFTEPGHYYVTHTWKTARPVTEKLYFGDPARPVHSGAGAQSGTFPFDMWVE